MTSFEFSILAFIHQNRSVTWGDVLRHFPNEQIFDVEDALFKLLNQDKFLETTVPHEKPRHCRLRLTEQGFYGFCCKAEQLQKDASIRAENIRREQTEEQKKLEQIAADKAERKAEQRAERIFQIFLTFLQAFLSFVAGLFAERYLGILNFVETLFT